VCAVYRPNNDLQVMGLEWMLGYHQLFKTACFQLVVKAAAFGLACYVNLTLD